MPVAEADINNAENKRAVNRNKIKSRRKQIEPMLEGLGRHTSVFVVHSKGSRKTPGI